MSKHTKGKWELEFVKTIHANTKMYWVNANTSVASENQHDAERIVACVNACAGIETDVLVKYWQEGGLLPCSAIHEKAELCKAIAAASKEVLWISDREHPAWLKLKALVAQVEAI